MKNNVKQLSQRANATIFKTKPGHPPTDGRDCTNLFPLDSTMPNHVKEMFSLFTKAFPEAQACYFSDFKLCVNSTSEHNAAQV